MEEHRLPFASFIKLRNNLAEVVVDEGVEVNLQMVGMIHEWLLINLDPPFSVVVNRINGYSYTPEAQPYIGSLPQLKAVAQISYSEQTDRVVERLAEYPREHPWNLKVFHNRTDAVDWAVHQ